ncbi:PhzF family phenazine biosynthesis isomerase [Sebaldella sp. S0638]|uniref:PhzF family phenazine biosynthesis isomerase n=1 Tax=Sebaldella sp. S0638 TaxID=2957809 RepID=UPI0020A0854F|nr:PhzF family phenazine biosynthesis isomerase [Sebaldella sp. S0638]MCP1223511.1 PhzF family phenazine biosynthesis isomerase [Sebaldella sp. S0638]
MKIYRYEAFTDKAGMGNPAGVVFECDDITEEEMQKTAGEIGFNETVFLLASKTADIKMRYFTPGHEMNLCGHATIAGVYALFEKENKEIKTVETLSGIINVNMEIGNNGKTFIRMKQLPAQFEEFRGDKAKLAEALGIREDGIEEKFPVIYGSTGIWTLLVPVKNLDTFLKMKPDNKKFPEILTEKPKASVHPFCLETYNENADMHGRHFSSPFSETVEDPVTGTASGVMGAYYIKFIKPSDEENIAIEQGHEIGKDGIVYVNVKKKDGNLGIEIKGEAVYAGEIFL